ncbi:hypothetical protein DFH11DRAFT_518239, partial [Phellopilus nigrolimitatus]
VSKPCPVIPRKINATSKPSNIPDPDTQIVPDTDEQCSSSDLSSDELCKLLPLVLERPTFPEIRDVDLAPSLANMEGRLLLVPPEHTRARLQVIGPKLYAATLKAHYRGAAKGLYVAVTIPANLVDKPGFFPTHMLGVRPLDKDGDISEVHFHLVHEFVLVAHCSSFSPFRMTRLPGGERKIRFKERRGKVTHMLPVLWMSMPSTSELPMLLEYLYTRCTNVLYRELVPSFCAEILSEANDPQEACDTIVHHLASSSPGFLIANALRVRGLWRNVCFLGVSDQRLWTVINCAWDNYIGALRYTGTLEYTEVVEFDGDIDSFL